MFLTSLRSARTIKPQFIFLIILLVYLFPFDLTGSNKIDSLQNALKEAGNPVEVSKIYGDIAWHYILRSELDSALQFADSIRISAEMDENPEYLAKSNFYYGVINRYRGNFNQAIDELWKYISFHQHTGDSVKTATGFFQIAMIERDRGNLETSLTYLYRIKQIYEKENQFYDLGNTLNGIGTIYRQVKKHQDAITTYHKSLTLFREYGALDDQANVLGNLANAFAEQQIFDSAWFYYHKALRIDKSLGNYKYIAYDYENMGTLFNLMKMSDSALFYQLEALKIREKLPGKHEHAISLRQLGETSLRRAEYAAAENYLKRALKIALGLGSHMILRDIYHTWYRVHSNQNSYRQALEYHQLYVAMKDSVLNEQSARQINQLKAQYEASEKDKQIINLAREKEMQEKEAIRQAGLKRTFMAGLVSISLLGGLLFYLFRQRHRHQNLLNLKNEEVKEANFRQQLSELELKALRAQINPHFLFNCMNSINRMILQGEIDAASSYLTKFSKLVRQILESTEVRTVTLTHELAMLEAYIQLESLRFKGKIDYIIQIDPSIDSESTCIPPMVLQPFVENAIWHGLMHMESRGTIRISIREDHDFLICTIEDNGIGRDKSRILQEKSVIKQRSMGIQITEERLRLLNREKLGQLISITDLKGTINEALGTRVDIKVPVA